MLSDIISIAVNAFNEPRKGGLPALLGAMNMSAILSGVGKSTTAGADLSGILSGQLENILKSVNLTALVAGVDWDSMLGQFMGEMIKQLNATALSQPGEKDAGDIWASRVSIQSIQWMELFGHMLLATSSESRHIIGKELSSMSAQFTDSLVEGIDVLRREYEKSNLTLYADLSAFGKALEKQTMEARTRKIGRRQRHKRSNSREFASKVDELTHMNTEGHEKKKRTLLTLLAEMLAQHARKGGAPGKDSAGQKLFGSRPFPAASVGRQMIKLRKRRASLK